MISRGRPANSGLIALVCTVWVGGPAHGQSPPLDITRIHTQFTEARTAAVACHAQDTATEIDFLANYQVVSIRAGMKMKDDNPGLTEPQLTQMFKGKVSADRAMVTSVIENFGCSAPVVQDLLKLYAIQSTKGVLTGQAR